MASERIIAYGGGNIVDDTTSSISATAGDDTIGTTQEHDDGGKAATRNRSPPLASTVTSSYYYNSFDYKESAEDNTTLKSPPSARPAAVSKGASTEYEELLSSTIISLLEKYIPGLTQRVSSSFKSGQQQCRVLQSSSSRSLLEIPSKKTMGLDNPNDIMIDYIESQSFEMNNTNSPPPTALSDSLSPPQSSSSSPSVFDQDTTPKANNFKTTGLSFHDFEHNVLDISATTSATKQGPRNQPPRRQYSNSTEYLPQSAAILLQTLQQCCNNSTNNNNTTTHLDKEDDQKLEDMLSFILQNSSNNSGGNNRSLGGRSGGSNSCSLDDDLIDNRGHDESNHDNHHHENDYDYYDDDDSLNGDMARLSKSIAHLQRDLDNIDVAQFDGMYYNNDDGDDDGGTPSTTNQQKYLDRGNGNIGNRWKGWIRNWLLSNGIINDEKVVNSLLSNDDDDDEHATTPGRGFTIFDFEMDHVLVVTLLLVFLVLLRNRFKTVNDLLFGGDNTHDDLEGMLGSDW